MRDRYVEYQRSTVIGTTSVDKKAVEAARRWNQGIDTDLMKKRKDWVFIPPSNMTISFNDGLVLLVPHEVGRAILHKRKGRIVERDVIVDAVIEGSFEDASKALNLL